MIRLYVDGDLAGGAEIALSGPQHHYLRDVMRRQVGDELLVFNGRDGEWRADIAQLAKRRGVVVAHEQVRRQEAGADLWLMFAPIKAARMTLVAEKACELGVSRLWPVVTARTQGGRVNLQRLRANAVEAAEQCGRLSVPEIGAPADLRAAVAGWPADRVLWFADESGGGAAMAKALDGSKSRKSAVLVGPEGGFSPPEVDFLRTRPFAVGIDLGPRILRADTAAIAALAVVQALAGDWQR